MRRWLRHSSLVLVEAVLVLGLLQELAQDWVLQRGEVPPMVRVAAGMALSVTLVAGAALIVQRQIVVGLRTTHAITRKLPLRVPKLVVHIVVLTGIFLGYAWLWEAETGALSACFALLPWLPWAG